MAPNLEISSSVTNNDVLPLQKTNNDVLYLH